MHMNTLVLSTHKTKISLVLAALALCTHGCAETSFGSGRTAPSDQAPTGDTPDHSALSADAQQIGTGQLGLPESKPQPSEALTEMDSTQTDGLTGTDGYRDFPTPTAGLDITATLGALFKADTNSDNSSEMPSESSGQQPQKVCQEVTLAIENQKPMDLVFNIDVSTSMSTSLETVKLNAQEFATQLSERGIDVRFAAVGYVDHVETVIPFSTSSSFAAQIAGWGLIDGNNRDIQEAGQAGLEHALYFLTLGRPGASKAIVHISDAVSFAKEDHDNLSVTDLASLFRNAQNTLGNIMFYNSTPTTYGTTGFPIGRQTLPYSPRDQMEELRSIAGGLAGQSLPFPFSAQTLTSDLPIEIETAFEQKVVCQ